MNTTFHKSHQGLLLYALEQFNGVAYVLSSRNPDNNRGCLVKRWPLIKNLQCNLRDKLHCKKMVHKTNAFRYRFQKMNQVPA